MPAAVIAEKPTPQEALPEGKPRQAPTFICEGLETCFVYFTSGKYYALDPRLKQGVHNPDASNGWTRVLVLDAGDKAHKILFYVPSLTGFLVRSDCRELELSRPAPWGERSKRFVVQSIREKAAQFARYGWEKSYKVGSQILEMLGEPPLDFAGVGFGSDPQPQYQGPYMPANDAAEETRRLDIKEGSTVDGMPVTSEGKKTKLHAGRTNLTQSVKAGTSKGGGKPAAESILKPIKQGSKVHAWLEYFQGEHGASVTEAMTKFNTTRSNVLSGLFVLNKTHGIGYTLSGDTARLTIPKGKLLA